MCVAPEPRGPTAAGARTAPSRPRPARAIPHGRAMTDPPRRAALAAAGDRDRETPGSGAGSPRWPSAVVHVLQQIRGPVDERQHVPTQAFDFVNEPLQTRLCPV